MKLTKETLKRIIKEELQEALAESQMDRTPLSEKADLLERMILANQKGLRKAEALFLEMGDQLDPESQSYLSKLIEVAKLRVELDNTNTQDTETTLTLVKKYYGLLMDLAAMKGMDKRDRIFGALAKY